MYTEDFNKHMNNLGMHQINQLKLIHATAWVKAAKLSFDMLVLEISPRLPSILWYRWTFQTLDSQQWPLRWANHAVTHEEASIKL